MDPQFFQQANGYPNIIPEVPEPLWLQALKHGKVQGEIGPVDYKLDQKQFTADTSYNDLMARLVLGFDGNSSLNLQKPMFGGLLGFNANHNDDGNNYRLQFRKEF